MGNTGLRVNLSLNNDEVESVEVDSLEKLAYVICWGYLDGGRIILF